jgi:NAD(P)-dependent dehydrogenase (short-subunit alcohol dehydrogenase family)
LHKKSLFFKSIDRLKDSLQRKTEEKSALNILTQSATLELAPYGIRVNAIAPGTTPYDEATIYESSVMEGIPLKRAGTPRDQASAAVYLASDDSSWVTGHILIVDGGQSLSF